MKHISFTTHMDLKGMASTPALTTELKALYGSDLRFPVLTDRPYVIGNFVQTLDGVASYSIPGQSGGGPIAGDSAEDRFLMGLLRSCVDAVMVGSGTLHGDPGHVRIPRFIYPDAENLYETFRKEVLKKREVNPLNVILSGSGRVDLAEPTFHTPDLKTVIITTPAGKKQLEGAYGDALSVTEIRVVSEGGAVSPRSILKILQEDYGVQLLLHEGGPRLFGEFLTARLLDELFLTITPQVAGRARANPRPSFAEEAAFRPENAPWFRLMTLKQAGDHLLLRLAVKRGGG